MVTAIQTRPPGLPTDTAILGRAAGENFTVASRLLPARVRGHLLAFYGYARLIDYLGDDYSGDRTAALDWATSQLDRALAGPPAATTGPPAATTGPPAATTGQPAATTGQPAATTGQPAATTGPPTATTGPPAAPGDTGIHPLILAAVASALEVGAGATPLRQLIEANQVDQVISSYATWDDLVGYCRLSADPIGHLVLAAFDVSTPPRRLLSDAVCTSLQVAEHLQDVAEDALAGRVYLPAEDLARFGVDGGDLAALARRGGPAPTALRALVAFEAWRARQLLDRGSGLVRTLSGVSRLAVAGFVAGGHGALDAVAEAGYDPFAGSMRPSRRRVAAHLLALVGRRRATGLGPAPAPAPLGGATGSAR